MLRSFSLSIIILLLLVSCNDTTIKSEYQSLKDASWHKNDTITFNFSELDTIAKHHIFINVRNDQNYPYSNLFLITELNYPNGDVVKDTLEYNMALPDGTWLGKGKGSLKESKLWFRENIVFPSSGVYTLQIVHAMRKNGTIPGVVDLEGITDVGFQIEKSKQ
ncbi:gliding motility lipoprotein GldH [uncultured Maribacter sp.]|uniref:gliding motility lipoprotein GldH n=1 Tax=uncultured Maribacter sp. TaxID=431308 RepID=UPI002618FEAE|nr:gliding motility lipoprotein GldH [uncultured Maribacter sp.]